MKLIGILLILLGIAGIGMGGMMFGDIGIACIVGGLSALLSGIGFLIVAKKIKKVNP
jgi:F0F1-type ATP synthase assembly protein I